MRLLILGGTSEASALARQLAGRRDIAAVLSLAGRTASPAVAPISVRIGGFGGVEGLENYLREQAVDAVVDATHPFAAQISAHAAQACARTDVPLAVFTRPPWSPVEGDHWIETNSAEQAAQEIAGAKVVFLTVGRLQLAAFAQSGAHFVLRTIDAPSPELLPASVELMLARGPFSVADELDLMRSRCIDLVVSKNSGGEATRAKIDAARQLGLPVVMIKPPPQRALVLYELAQVVAWLDDHSAAP